MFHQYVLIGGFPEAVKSYAEIKDLTQVQKIYDDLMLGYYEDVIKYAPNETVAKYIRHVIQHAPLCTGERIKFHGFG